MSVRRARNKSESAPPPTVEVAGEWSRRVEAEYTSAALTQHLVLWLIQIGAPPEMVRDGLRIVDDELTHAELSGEVAAASGSKGLPGLDRNRLGLRRESTVLELDVATALVRIFCLGETVAVPLFSHLRRGATVPVVRRALDRIARDEVRHRDFGWDALEWLIEELPGAPIAATILQHWPDWWEALLATYGSELENPRSNISPAERAWGLAPALEYAQILSRTLERDYRPRFHRLGIELPTEG